MSSDSPAILCDTLTLFTVSHHGRRFTMSSDSSAILCDTLKLFTVSHHGRRLTMRSALLPSYCIAYLISSCL